MRYAAFISYTHADARWARWLHRRLERYRVPKGLAAAGERRPLRPVFRDRDELPAGHSLPDAIEAALAASDALVVIASPRAARSVWVGREIEAFRRLHGEARVFALVVDGDPGDPGEADETPFPPALLAPPPGQAAPLDPLAADARRGGDGRERAFLKIAAGLLGVGYDRLAEREAAARNKRLVGIASGSTAMSVAVAGLALYADQQRRAADEQREAAERNLRTAERVSDFLVDTFAIANPATESADTITARTILERGIATVEEGLADEPEVQARIYDTLGEVATDLALFNDAERMLDEAYALMAPGTGDAFENRVNRAHLMERLGKLDEAEALLTQLIAETEATMPDDWKLIGSAYHTLGNVQVETYDGEAAAKNYLLAEQHYRNGGEDAIGLRGIVLSNAALANALAGRYSLADAQFQAAVVLLETQRSSNEIALARAQLNYAALLVEKKNFVQAKIYLEDTLSIYESILPENHPDVTSARSLNIELLEGQGQLREAEREATGLVRIQREVYPEGHLEVGYALVGHASILIGLGRASDALAVLRDAGDEYRRVGTDDAMLYGDLDAYRGLAYAKMGDAAEAQRLCAQGLEVLAATLGGDHPYTSGMRDRCRTEIDSEARASQRPQNDNP